MRDRQQLRVIGVKDRRNGGRTFAGAAADLLIWIYAACIVGWQAGRWLSGDQVWLLALLNSVPVLAFLPIPVVVLLAAWRRRRLLWAAALVPVVIWLALFGWRFLPRSAQDAVAGSALRVMAFNVLVSNRDVDAVVAAVDAAQPDLIALAELDGEMHARLGGRLGGDYPYRTLQRLPGATFGTAIYSRWPLDDLGSLQTGLGLRSAAADVSAPGGTVRFVALHLRSIWIEEASPAAVRAAVDQAYRAREAQAAAVCDYLDRWGDRPVIVAGDLNMTEFNAGYRCLADRLNDAYRAIGWGYGSTWPAPSSNWRGPEVALWQLARPRIDHILHSGHWVAQDARVLTLETGSDHRPVVATLRPALDHPGLAAAERSR